MPVNPRILISTNSNFMQTRGNLPTAIKVMRAADTVVSFEIKLSLTAQFADIILPVCTHWEGNDDEAWGELSWPSAFGDGNGQKQRKDALLAWRPLIKPLYEAREEKRVFREIIERMGFNPDDAYPKSNYDQWLGYFLGMRVLNEDLTKWEPVITWTDADNEKYLNGARSVSTSSWPTAATWSSARPATSATTWATATTNWASGLTASPLSWPTPPGRARRFPASWRSTASSRPTT